MIAPPLTESVTWLSPALPPDTDRNVMLSLDESPENPTWPGYFGIGFSGDRVWHMADGSEIRAEYVLAWAEMPKGCAR